MYKTLATIRANFRGYISVYLVLEALFHWVFLLIPLLAGDDDSPYMFDHGDNGTSEHLHPLLHVLVVVWVLQFSSLAHVKLTYLTVLVNLLDTGMEHHQGSLRLFPVKMLAS